ncbi:hypothetical protein TanjilG_18764 [Lupinus angustifolius]|uniref:Uncharacterized protein n=1 Tax=Lupinus angustifolius TaxID=3871 RepID=A0A1J7GVB0_LUPAN|nr:hypothetical protein TanjilG_18764 [Lupinus angustifolius]
MNIMDHDMPEMVVFIQEDNDESIKDITVDKGQSQEGKCILEDCEFHHNIIPCLFDPNMNRSSGSNLQTTEIMSPNSNGSKYVSQSPFIKDGMKNYDCDYIELMLEAEVDIDSREEGSTNYARKEISSQTCREVFRKEPDISRSIKNGQINSYLGSIDSIVDFAHCADYLQVTDGTNMSMPKMGNPQNLTSSGTSQVDYPENTSSCVICPIATPTSYIGHAKTSSGASLQSDDSTSSTHSFAFPM